MASIQPWAKTGERCHHNTATLRQMASIRFLYDGQEERCHLLCTCSEWHLNSLLVDGREEKGVIIATTACSQMASIPSCRRKEEKKVSHHFASLQPCSQMASIQLLVGKDGKKKVSHHS
ncbi:hypothetical protein AVEN_209469-1 [Araneus ventricosus]|uniref:Uncharacterized protein n=1 Tax=Araneus ventricosus TaxID=182803 RepID=A0A4Y2HC11_ARAVE|nr:hypothetical protein AVEN_209469-1 [Araneus ventricosus]